MITALSTKNDVATRADILKTFPFGKPIAEIGVEQDEKESADSKIIDNITSLPKFKNIPNQMVTPFDLLQQWEGCVRRVSSNEFTASLYDLTNKRGVEDEEADFSTEDLMDDDKKLLKPGAVFRWLIGYRIIGGTKERTSRLVFRRLPQWTDSDFDTAKEKAEYYSSNTKWE